MSGFLQRLARRQVEEPAIRPRALPRVAWPAAIETPAANPVARRATPTRQLDLPAHITATAIERVGPRAGDTTAREVGLVQESLSPLHAEISAGPAVGTEERQRPLVDAPRTTEPGALDAAYPVRPNERPSEEPEPRTSTARISPIGDEADAAPDSLDEVSGRVHPRPTGSRRATLAEHDLGAPSIVKVHIARVEVRAVMSQPERARQAAPRESPAALSLDQYLAGKRRA